MSNSVLKRTTNGALRALLPKVSRMHRVRGVAGLVINTKRPLRRFLISEGDTQVSLRVADHFDLKADAVVIDGILGSLGLVHCIPEAELDRAWVREKIDQAAYLRHLLLAAVRPGTPEAGESPYTVEIVFVTPATSAGQDAEARIGDVLREITRDDSYLDAIGINLWTLRESSGSIEPDAGFRRAFSWLLHCAESWLKSATAQPATPVDELNLSALKLVNFRVAGERRIGLDQRTPLHVVFGHNGSGKSSLCEAIELVLTGKIERLDCRHEAEKPDYAKVITNRTAYGKNQRAQITIEGPGKSRGWIVIEEGVKDPLASGLVSAAFRMDQVLADALAQGNTAARARLFLRAFFPSVRTELEKFDSIEERTQKTLGKLPDHLRVRLQDTAGNLDAKKADSILRPLAADAVNWEEVLKLLPLSPELLNRLLPMLAQTAADAVQHKGTLPVTEVNSRLPVLDGALSAIVSGLESHIQTLEQATQLLEEYAAASVSDLPPETEELGALINQWLEHHALVDLLEREDRVQATIECAQRDHYEFDAASAPALAAKELRRPPTERGKLLDECRRDCDEFRRRITSFTTAAERAAQQAKQLRPLGEFHVASLRQAAANGVFGNAFRSTNPALDVAITQAFRERTPVAVMSGNSPLLRVGEPGWGKELLEKAKQSRQTLNELREVYSKITDPGAAALGQVWPALGQLRQDLKELSGVDQALTGQFAGLISSDSLLGQAINELMALFTPARWAYQDIVPSIQRQGRERLLEVRTPDKVHADLRLNTAELNTFAMTLFLLCARGNLNPLRLLVLDDPLQNMDELTVTTVARGIGRLLRLWNASPKGAQWRVLLFAHSEASLERFRNETPCASHLLPWLSPNDETKQNATQAPLSPGTNPRSDDLDPRRIKSLGSLLKPKLQSLGQLIAPTVQSAPSLGTKPP